MNITLAAAAFVHEYYSGGRCIFHEYYSVLRIKSRYWLPKHVSGGLAALSSDLFSPSAAPTRALTEHSGTRSWRPFRGSQPPRPSNIDELPLRSSLQPW